MNRNYYAVCNNTLTEQALRDVCQRLSGPNAFPYPLFGSSDNFRPITSVGSIQNLSCPFSFFDSNCNYNTSAGLCQSLGGPAIVTCVSGTLLNIIAHIFYLSIIYIHIAVFAINMLEIILRRTQLSLRSVLIPVVPPPCNDGSIQSAELGQGNYPNGTQISIRQPEICSNGDYVPVCQDGLGVDASIGICAVQFGYFGMLPLTVSYTAQTDM